jgi:hypothetical protein
VRETAAAVRERRAGAIGEAPTITLLQSYVRPLVVAVVAGAFLALIGALGTGDAPLILRLAYWIGLSVLGALLGTTTALIVGRLWPGLGSTWWRALVIVAVLTPLFTALVWFAGGRTPLTPRVLDRLPPRLRGGEIYAVEAEDHYLRLHTSKGQDLILLRLSDAVAELEGVEGAQTHRSWWVAKAAVRDAKRGDGRATLTLTSGVEAPVSRAYARTLREAGWY